MFAFPSLVAAGGGIKSVQRGATVPGGTFTNVTIAKVNTAKAFVIGNSNVTSYSVQLLNETTVKVIGSSGTTTVEWQVVEFA